MERKILSRCTRHDPNSVTTRCEAVIYTDGTLKGSCCGGTCRFARMKAGEGYPPLPSPQEQLLIKALDTALRLTRDSSQEEIYTWFEQETGYTRPELDDKKYSQHVRKKAFDAWLTRKYKEVLEVMGEYAPPPEELSVPQVISNRAA